MFYSAGIVLIYFTLCCFAIFKFKSIQIRETSLTNNLLLFSLKVVFSFILGYYYFRYGAVGDTFTFFNSSKIISDLAFSDPIIFLKIITGTGSDQEINVIYNSINGWNTYDRVFNDSRTIIRLNAMIGLISFGNYYVHAILFAFLSYIGSVGIYKFIKITSSISEKWIIVAVFLIPSVLFWTSGANKEAVLIFVLGMCLYQFALLVHSKNKFVHFTYFALLCLVFVHIKAYILVLLLPALISLAWSNRNLHLRSWSKYLIIYSLFFGAILLIQYTNKTMDAFEILHSKRYNFEAFVQSAPNDNKSYIILTDFEPTLKSILNAAPSAFFSTLIRPWFGDIKSFFSFLVSIENMTMIFLLIWSLFKSKSLAFKVNSNLIWFCIFFTISNFVLIGLTTPVLGAVVRYKAPILPFLMIIPFLITPKNYDENSYTFDVTKKPSNPL